MPTSSRRPVGAPGRPAARAVRRVGVRLCGLAAVAALAACAHDHLPGTQIRATADNREVFAVVERLRDALERRDAGDLLAIVSPLYFEDNGTPSPDDDYGYLELEGHLLHETLGLAKEMHVGFELYDIVVRGDYAYVDLRYAARARLELPGGRLWDSHRDFNRLELARENGAWRVTGGL